MTVTPTAEYVQQVVVQTFARFGVAIENVLDLNETILISDGVYRARTYRAGGLMAMWMWRQGIVQFYDEQGNLLEIVNLLQDKRPLRVAA